MWSWRVARLFEWHALRGAASGAAPSGRTRQTRQAPQTRLQADPIDSPSGTARHILGSRNSHSKAHKNPGANAATTAHATVAATPCARLMSSSAPTRLARGVARHRKLLLTAG